MLQSPPRPLPNEPTATTEPNKSKTALPPPANDKVSAAASGQHKDVPPNAAKPSKEQPPPSATATTDSPLTPWPKSQVFVEPPPSPDYSDWLEDFQAAKQAATRDNRDIVIFFDASDWCGYCKAMTREIFLQPSFRQKTKTKYVFVHVDSPRSPEAKAKVQDFDRNSHLQSDFGIGSFPTIILTDRDGHVLGCQDGYLKGGADRFATLLTEWQATGALLKRAIAAVNTAKGELARREAIDQVRTLAKLQGIARFYEKQLAVWQAVMRPAGGSVAASSAAKPADDGEAPPPVSLPEGEEGPARQLAHKGLQAINGVFVLGKESELNRMMRQSEALQKSITDGQKAATLADKEVQRKDQLILGLLQQRSVIRGQLAKPNLVTNYNALVTAYDEINGRLMLLTKSKQEEAALKAAQAKVGAAREKFIDQLLADRQLYDRLGQQYQRLAGDRDVSQAIDEYNKTAGKPHQIGPTSAFALAGRKLKRMEALVLSDEVVLRQGEGNLWMLSVMLNGKHVEEFAVDTGASVVSLPWKTAVAAGLKPNIDDPKLQMEMADGHTITGWRVTAPTIRVGKFTAERVTCVVLPPEAPNASPLLGLSFLQKFSYKIDAGKSRLILHQLDRADAGRAGDTSP